MGDELVVLRFNQLHVARRHREGHVDLIGDTHLRHSDLVHTRQMDLAFDTRQLLEAELGGPPFRSHIPDFLLHSGRHQLIGTRDQRPTLLGIIVAKGSGILDISPDMFGHGEGDAKVAQKTR